MRNLVLAHAGSRSRRAWSLARWTTVLGAIAVCCLSSPLAAQRRGGGGRSVARDSVGARGGQYERARGNDARTDRTANVNRNYNQNVNVNRDVNVDVHNDVYARGYHYDGWGHPVAAAAAVTATAIAVGTIVASLPPSCSATVVNGVTIQNCGGTYYQPVYQGTTVQYVVVNAP